MRKLAGWIACGALLLASQASAQAPSEQQLKRWLKRFPKADANGDGTLSVAEATAFMRQMRGRGRNAGAPREFEVDPGWEKERFPEHAVSYKTPEEIRKIYANVAKPGSKPVVSYDKPTDGAVRIVATGHSFMAPGFKTFPIICKAAGMDQPLYTHTGGGMTGSARYKWEEENGIFQFDGRPAPKLLASISNASWDAMMWGPYFNDRAKYYACWIDFCLKYNPEMKFYLSDAWPQLYQLGQNPKTEDTSPKKFLTAWQATAAESMNGKSLNSAKTIPTASLSFPPVTRWHWRAKPTCMASCLASKGFTK